MDQQTFDLSSPRTAEQSFYSAFARCDMEAMARIWAGSDIFCIHPGTAMVTGRDAVLRSWASILDNALMPNIRVVLLHRSECEGLAVHVVEEHIPDPDDLQRTSLVMATNVYRHEHDRWLIQAHHASATSAAPRSDLQ